MRKSLRISNFKLHRIFSLLKLIGQKAKKCLNTDKVMAYTRKK